jgi:hypothetical protein
VVADLVAGLGDLAHPPAVRSDGGVAAHEEERGADPGALEQIQEARDRVVEEGVGVFGNLRPRQGRVVLVVVEIDGDAGFHVSAGCRAVQFRLTARHRSGPPPREHAMISHPVSSRNRNQFHQCPPPPCVLEPSLL